ncbi:MAG: hypothetical protein WC584_03650 [Candidatus Pacearchaeota archaeon]
MEEQKYEEKIEIKDTSQYIQELEKIVHHDKELRKIVGHEIRNRLNSLNGFPELLIKSVNALPISQASKDPLIDYCTVVQRNVKQIEGIATLLHLGSLKHRDLKNASEQFDLEEMIRENALSLKTDLEKNYLGLDYSYDKKDESPIQVYAHKGFMNAIINTILFNLLKHAPKNSLNKIGLSIQNESLELICENLIGKSREGYGEQTGVGFYLLNLAKRQLRGNLETEISRIDRKYDFNELIGYKDARELENHDIFSLRFYIPIKELTFHPPKKQ